MNGNIVISKAALDDAKSFLCWDVFTDLAVQLVPVLKETAYYYPADNEVDSIILFYNFDGEDSSEPLFLLFHEAGHKQQAGRMGEKFREMMEIPNGVQRQDFEREAWRFARQLFIEYVEHHNLDENVLEKFDQCAQKSINSYSESGG